MINRLLDKNRVKLLNEIPKPRDYTNVISFKIVIHYLKADRYLPDIGYLSNKITFYCLPDEFF